MMDIKFLFPSILLLVAAYASAGEVQHGIIKLDGAGHAILIVTHPLVAGQTVYFQYPGAMQQLVCCKHLKADEFVKADGSDMLATNEVTGNPLLIYSARLPKMWAETPFVGAAAIGQNVHVAGINSRLVAKTRQGPTSRIETCTSQEGVHLIAKEGQAEVTHIYLSLGYDVEHPSCR